MGNNKLLSWTAFTLFFLAVVSAVVAVFAPTFSQFGLYISEIVLWGIGVFALLSMILGLVAFKTSQGKIATIGGALFLLALLIIIPFFTIVR